MNSKVCLLFGALVTLSFLSAAGDSEDSLSGELSRAADTNPGRSKEKLKMAKKANDQTIDLTWAFEFSC